MRLVLSRLVEADFDAIVPVCFAAFTEVDMVRVFFGNGDAESLAHTKRSLLKDWRNDPADLWLKVTDEDAEAEVTLIDEETGAIKGKEMRKRIVAASNWKIYANYIPPKPEVEDDKKKPADDSADPYAHITWLYPPAHKRDAALILKDFMARRRRACQEAHLLCFMMFVDPAYQRRGVGYMVMKWGAQLADQMMLPSWIEASPFGRPLYELVGFREVEKVHLQTESFLSEYTHMRRPVTEGKLELSQEGELVLKREKTG